MSSDAFRILEVFDRSRTGPSCKKNDFELKELPNKLRELAKEYDIKYDPDQPVPNDNSLADSLYQAGFQLFTDLGILCADTERLIKFDENEVNSILRNLIPEAVVGLGRDARRVYYRKVEDTTPPVIYAGPFGGPLTAGKPFVDAQTSFAKEPLTSMIYYGSLREIEGRKVILGSPIEIHAARCEARWMREAAARAGRPGMQVVGTMAESAAATIAASDPINGYRPSDGRDASLLTSLKISYNVLNKVKHYLDYSTTIYAYHVDLVGGYTGGPDTCAIAAVASNLANTVINQATYNAICITHIHRVNTTSRECVWAQNLTSQALSRNTKIKVFQTVMPSSGPCTDMVLYETAATSTGAISGSNLLGVMCTGSKLPDRYTGLEQRFMGEVGYASTRLNRENANELTKELLTKYEKRFENPPTGKTFQECYDTDKLTPKQEWLDIYTEVKKELIDSGLNLKD